MMEKCLYISGMITGLSKSSYEYNFNKAEEILKFQNPNADVINPLKIPPFSDESWTSYLRNDIIALCTCDEICMLPNWICSKGAWVELLVAKVLGIKIKFLKMKLAKG